jgi:LuxR family maltose regulon positive regulatory protein
MALQSALRFNLGAALLSLGQVDEAVEQFEQTRRAAGPGHYAGAMAIYCLADTAYLRGRLPAAEVYCREALDDLARTAPRGLPPIAGALQIALGRVYLEWDRLDEAEALLARGVRAMALTGEAAVVALGWQGLAQIHALRGQAERALEDVARARAVDVAVGGVLGPAVWWPLGRMDPTLAERALRWARGVTLPRVATPLPGMVILDADYAAHTQAARIRIAAARRGDRLTDELVYLRRQGEEAHRRGWTDYEITLGILQSLAHAARGEEVAGLAALRGALALAEPGGYVRRFLDHGAPLARLLYRCVERGDMVAYASRLLAALPDPPPQPAVQGEGRPVEALSARELEILSLIAAGLSNQEIALRLNITPGTVKVHAHRLYGKLGASGRTAAVARGRALGLLGGR